MTPAPVAKSPSNVKPSPRFVTTRWSLVLQARDKGDPNGVAALADLCRAYWFPLYAFIRKRSRDGHEAQDLTQSFFARLLEKDFLDDVLPERGRFRAFLLAAVRHFVANEWDKQRAEKRGGGRWQQSLDAAAFDWESGESRYLIEPSHDLTPERLFERQWAFALLERVLSRLRDEHVNPGKRDQFEALQPFLSTDRDSANYTDAASHLNITVEAARVAAHRLRKRYRQLLRDEIAQTVASPEQVDDELRHLFAVLAVRT
jgi:RNA polymerase sigma factor (sigma-70 family)